MSREEYLSKLAKCIKNIPEQERENALSYYREYFEEAGEDNTAAVIAELGSPKHVAAGIIGDFAVRDMENKKKSGGALKTVGLVLMAIFAAPIALPLAIAAVAVIVAVLISLGAVLVSLGASGGAVFLSGFVLIISGIVAVFTNMPLGILALGYGLLGLGLGAALVIATIKLFKIFFRGIVRFVNERFLRREKGMPRKTNKTPRYIDLSQNTSQSTPHGATQNNEGM